VERIKQRWKNRSHKTWRIAVVLLVLYFACTRTWVWVAINHTNNQTAADYFDHVVQSEVAELSNRFEIYADTLYLGQALFLTDHSVSRRDWTNFVDTQDIKQRYPGINGISYVRVIPRNQATALAQELNANRLPTEKKPVIIYPTSTDSQLAVITYLAPESISQSPIGYDLFTSTARRQTLYSARDTGMPQSSPPLSLVSDQKGEAPSFLLAIPTYDFSASLKTISERRAALKGFIVLSIHSQPLLDSIFRTSTPYGKFELTASTNQQMIYHTGVKPSGRTLQKVINVNVAGQTWRFSFAGPSDFGLGTTAKVARTALFLSTIPLIFVIGFMMYYGTQLRAVRRHHQDKHHK
jgi:CHASE1-domain containing sensor protein